MKTLLSTLLIVALFAVTACDDSSDSTSMTQDKFLAQAPSAMCDAIEECCTDAGSWSTTDYVDYQDCVDQSTASLAAEFENDHVTVNESRLGAAYESMQGILDRNCTEVVSDEEFWGYAIDFMAAFEPAQALGEACNDSSECMGDAYCDYDSSVCAAYVALGDDCSEGWCEDGAYCKDDVCVEALVAGDPCDDLDSYPNCWGGVDLYCDVENEVCVETKAVGEACTEDDECQSWDCNTDLGTCADDTEVVEEETLEDLICESDDQVGTGTAKK